jgi:DNA-binding LacI/PurR family transcriptional regulator
MAGRNRKKANITEVAQAAGVSTMTVSRMLNHASKVAPATRIKVQRVIDELEYQPDPIARGLVTSRTRIIGLMVFDEEESAFFHQMLIGVQYAVGLTDYNLLIFSKSNEKKIQNNRYLNLADGVLCMGMHFDNETIEQLELSGIPYAVIGRRNWRKANPWFYAVDYVSGFQRVTRYLLEMGHRKIAMIGGWPDYEPDMEKYVGYKQALEDAGIPYNSKMILYEGESNKIRGMLEEFRPTAVIVEGANMLLALLICIRDMGLSVPGQISVIGTRNEMDIHTVYSLTGIHELTLAEVPQRDLGISGANLLIRLIEGERNIPKGHRIDLRFTEGESCAPPSQEAKQA